MWLRVISCLFCFAIGKQSLYGYTTVCLYILLLVDIWFVLAIINKVAMDILVLKIN